MALGFRARVRLLDSAQRIEGFGFDLLRVADFLAREIFRKRYDLDSHFGNEVRQAGKMIVIVVRYYQVSENRFFRIGGRVYEAFSYEKVDRFEFGRVSTIYHQSVFGLVSWIQEDALSEFHVEDDYVQHTTFGVNPINGVSAVR